MRIEPHDNLNAAAGESTYGARFLAAYRERAQGVTWHYDTIQEMKACDREAFIKLLRNRGGVTYETIQHIRSSTPEEFAAWLFTSQQDASDAWLVLGLIMALNT